MRYYELTLTTPSTDPNPGRVVKQWSSHPGGVFDPAAQNIEFDMLIAPYNTPIGGATIIIEGISLNDLQQAQQFTGLNLVLKAGMQTGLPLANPNQAGVIAAGFIFQSFGNWEGTEMTLAFVVYPNQYYMDTPGNVVLNWKANSSLSEALKSTINTAFPGVKTNINISPDLKLSHDEVGNWSSLTGLAQSLGPITQAQGHQVFIVMQNGVIEIFDDTYKPNPIQLQFTDLVGQPTWINVDIMQIKMVMRADITVGAYILMPQGLQSAPGIVLTQGQSLPSTQKYKSSFQGQFYVTEMRQIGNYRSPDGASWITVMNCAAVQ